MSFQVKSSRASIAGAASQPLSTIQLMPSEPEAPQPARRNDEAVPHAGLTAAPMRPGLRRRTKPPSARTHDDAITTAYREHRESMLAKALWSDSTHNRETAQDIVQLSFEKACKHPEGFTSSRGSVRNWLSLSLKNTAIDLMMSLQTHPENSGVGLRFYLRGLGARGRHIPELSSSLQCQTTPTMSLTDGRSCSP